MRPRIAIVAPSLEILGGQGVQAQMMLRRLREEGYDVTFVPVNPAFPRGLRWLRRLPYARTVLNQALYIPSLARLRHADVAHVFSASYWSFVVSPLPAILAARLFGARVVLNYRSGEADDHLTNWGALVHPWLRLVHAIVVPSQFLSDVFGRHGYRTQIIRNVVDTARFAYRERAPLRPRLVSVRNFETHYRVANTVEAFSFVRARYPEATLTLAGYGSEEARLRALVASRGLGGVTFLGRVSPDAMPGVYGQADIFVNSSVIDNQPNSVLEAFAAGLPVVSTGTGEIATMVRDGETGLIVPPDDPAAMAKAVTALLESPESAAVMTRRARADVEQYDWPQARRRWLDAYTNGTLDATGERDEP
jgi:glycosyltransferase involved in cell wall biosynthesis